MRRLWGQVNLCKLLGYYKESKTIISLIQFKKKKERISRGKNKIIVIDFVYLEQTNRSYLSSKKKFFAGAQKHLPNKVDSEP